MPRGDASCVHRSIHPFIIGQVESRCEVRAPLKRPGNGDLPLPPADALAAAAPLSCTALPPLPEIGLSEAALGEASRTLRRDAVPRPLPDRSRNLPAGAGPARRDAVPWRRSRRPRQALPRHLLSRSLVLPFHSPRTSPPG